MQHYPETALPANAISAGGAAASVAGIDHEGADGQEHAKEISSLLLEHKQSLFKKSYSPKAAIKSRRKIVSEDMEQEILEPTKSFSLMHDIITDRLRKGIMHKHELYTQEDEAKFED